MRSGTLRRNVQGRYNQSCLCKEVWFRPKEHTSEHKIIRVGICATRGSRAASSNDQTKATQERKRQIEFSAWTLVGDCATTARRPFRSPLGRSRFLGRFSVPPSEKFSSKRSLAFSSQLCNALCSHIQLRDCSFKAKARSLVHKHLYCVPYDRLPEDS